MADLTVADLGYTSLLLSLFLSLYAAGAALFAVRRNRLEVFASARNAVFAVAALTTLAVGILEWALITHRLLQKVRCVAQSSPRSIVWHARSDGRQVLRQMWRNDQIIT